MDEFLTLNGLISMLQSYKEEYGGNIPVLLVDGDSPNSLTNVANTFVIDILEKETGESQTVVLLTNLSEDELVNESGFDFSPEEDEDFSEED